MRRIGGSIRVAWLGVAVSVAALVVLVAACQVGASTYGSSFSGGTLSGSPLVVQGAGRLFAGQQEADEEAKRANPLMAVARERSRGAYTHLTATAVSRLLAHSFPALVQHRAGTPELPVGAHIVGYPSTHAAQLTLPGHRLAIAESTWPLAKRGLHGRLAPIDLTLTHVGSAYVPVRSGVTVRIPGRLSAGISTPGNGVTVTPVGAGGEALAGANASVTGASVVYANTEQAADTVVKPTPTGFQLDAVLRSASSPQQLFFKVSGPSGSRLVQDPASGIVRVVLGKATLASISPPGATDAAGTPVPASMSISGHTVVVYVDHRAASYLYPIYVDPEVNDSQLAEVTGGKRSNWVFKSSNEAKFGHKAVYEGPGKEHLETTGIAEYKAAEFAYWAYETKGNSKIYELKTKTSGKNKLAKIESILQFASSAGNENWKPLSTEFEEPEYSEKVSTICAWNASKIEECLSGSGKEKNAIRFQQSATASPGANFKFSDTMSEGIISISEPAGEHSTTSFNTTSPEVEGEIEEGGKKVVQKRTNALYGSGIWLTKSRGALQFISKDPGIGVATTRLEYEKSAGSWEKLSEHHYIEENACLGVQCYAEHPEYWTVDPKLPDGEDKIRYRAEEAISGTVSPEAEAESTKTVKVDTSSPHNISLGGLPWGNELTEKPYKLVATAIDGTGSTVASSGVKKLALFVSGHEITELGTQTGCIVAKGECSAKAEWSINGAELGAGHHAIVIVATDNAGNESRAEETISIRHSTPVAMGPGSVDLQSGDFTLGASDVAMGSGLTVGRGYSSRATEAGMNGPLGPQWSLSLGPAESVVEMPDKSILLTDANGKQAIFAALESGAFESPIGDTNLKLRLEENEAKEKLAYYVEDLAKHTKTKFTLPSASSVVWVPTKQEGTVATDTLSYSYQTVEQNTEYAVPSTSHPNGIVAGPDGNLWFTEFSGNKIGKMTTWGTAVEYALPEGSGPAYITVGPDNNLWFTDSASGKIGKITTAGVITEYSLPAGSKPTGITTGPDGNLWYTVRSTNKIGKITTAGAVVAEYSLPASSGPYEITTGPDGNLWFAESESNKIAKISTSGALTEYSLPAGALPQGIAVGADKNLWFVGNEYTTKKIGKITTSGVVTEYGAAGGIWMTQGPDRNVWFVSAAGNKIGKVTTSGQVTEYPLPALTQPMGITVGPDGNLWFANYNLYTSSTIGTMTPAGTITEPTQVLAPVPAGVSCSPMKAGCRALKFTYASSTTATGENQSEWGQYKGRLIKVLLNAYNPISKEMQETAVAEYSYDKTGRLRAEWDPRTSPALKTTYGYDVEGHVVASTPPGQESWAFTYGIVPGDSGTGRLLKVARAPASEALWNGEAVKNTEAPAITGSPVVGVRMAVSNGKWSGSPVTYGYQWNDCNSAGAACTPIAGATNANYTPVLNDVGHRLVATVAATNGDGSVAIGATSAKIETREYTKYALPSSSGPYHATLGSDGNVWFTNNGTSKIGKVTPSGEVTEYALPAGSEPRGIVAGPDGNLWFTDWGTNKIGAMTTSGVILKEYALPASSNPQDITVGPDGNLWFTDWTSLKVGKITTSGTITEYAAGSNPYDITKGPDGNLWFTKPWSSSIGKITTSGTVTSYSAGSEPYGIATGSDGNLWFADHGNNKAGKITTGGTVTEYALTASGTPLAITPAADGNLYVTEYGSCQIAKVTTGGAVTQYEDPSGSEYTGSGPVGIVSGPSEDLWVANNAIGAILRFNPNVTEGGISEGSAVTPTVGTTLEYGVPLSGSGLPTMTSGEVAKWGQSDAPAEATAILPPDAVQGWPASSYKRATIYYLDEQGHEVNVASPSTSTNGSVSTTEYNEDNDVVRTLSPNNRLTALEAGSKSVDVAKSLSTYMSYREECSKESENNHEVEDPIPGARLCDVEAPQHQIKYVVGGEQKESLARLHIKYFYDENAPEGETYNLQTKMVTLAVLSNEAKEEVEGRVTKMSYSGQSSLGWKLRAPTSVTVDPEGKKLTTTTVYNATTGQITETRSPAGGAGESAHDTKFVYYSAEANTEGYSACGSHPEWAGLVCETLPAKQPASGPKLPVTTSTYNIWNEPLVVTETFGSTVRTRTKTYDAAGRLATDETKSTANTALPKVTDEYSSGSGALEKQSTTVEGKTTTITSKYNYFGQLSEYTDADGNIAKYRYGSPENDGLLEEVADGSGGGTGKQSYSYNSTTKLLGEVVDSAAGTFKASYDAEGNMTSEVYPNAMCADMTYNSVGQATQIEYLKTATCSQHSAPVWYTETLSPAVRGETLSRSSTLATEKYTRDTVGRLLEAQETPVGEGCSVRLYSYNEESSRTSQTTRTPGTGGKCATEGGVTLEHTYDEGNHLSDSGVSYDSFGNLTKVSAADAEGHELSSSFYVDGAVASQTQNGTTYNYYLDPEGRIRETASGTNITTTHYDGPGGAIGWTSETGGKSTRNIPGIDGSLAATQTNGAEAVLQLHDLQGDVVATASLSTSATKVLSAYNSTEFGVPNAEKTPPKFAWLGAANVASSLPSGVVTYGLTSYVPQLGRALQSEMVEPPAASGGSGAGAAYVSQLEPWVFQGAASAAAEAPGREAAREQAAAEAAAAAAEEGAEEAEEAVEEPGGVSGAGVVAAIKAAAGGGGASASFYDTKAWYAKPAKFPKRGLSIFLCAKWPFCGSILKGFQEGKTATVTGYAGRKKCRVAFAGGYLACPKAAKLAKENYGNSWGGPSAGEIYKSMLELAKGFSEATKANGIGLGEVYELTQTVGMFLAGSGL